MKNSTKRGCARHSCGSHPGDRCRTSDSSRRRLQILPSVYCNDTDATFQLSSNQGNSPESKGFLSSAPRGTHCPQTAAAMHIVVTAVSIPATSSLSFPRHSQLRNTMSAPDISMSRAHEDRTAGPPMMLTRPAGGDDSELSWVSVMDDPHYDQERLQDYFGEFEARSEMESQNEYK